MQTRLQSFIEAWSNTIIGYLLNLGVQLVVYPLYGATFTFGQNIQIGLIFMVVSIARSYALRRFYNHRHPSYIQDKLDAAVAAEREACKQACANVRAEGGGTAKPYEDNHADGFIDGCNECEWAIDDRSNAEVSGAGTASAGLPGSAANGTEKGTQ